MSGKGVKNHRKIEFNKNNFAHIPKTLICRNDLFMGLFAKCGAMTEYA